MSQAKPRFKKRSKGYQKISHRQKVKLLKQVICDNQQIKKVEVLLVRQLRNYKSTILQPRQSCESIEQLEKTQMLKFLEELVSGTPTMNRKEKGADINFSKTVGIASALGKKNNNNSILTSPFYLLLKKLKAKKSRQRRQKSANLSFLKLENVKDVILFSILSEVTCMLAEVSQSLSRIYNYRILSQIFKLIEFFYLIESIQIQIIYTLTKLSSIISQIMNPFERLKMAIDKVNINYNYAEEEEKVENDNEIENRKTISTHQNQDEFVRLRELCETQQASQMKEITILSSKVEKLTKDLKRMQVENTSLVGDVVTLEKENELLKYNLTQQYSNLTSHDDKERKFKEEIHRLNVCVNQLGSQINFERNTKKNMQRQVSNLQDKNQSKDELINTLKQRMEKEVQQLKAELIQRVQMFEYNVKKAAEERSNNKANHSKMQQNYEKSIEDLRKQIDRLNIQNVQYFKQNQISLLKLKASQEKLDILTRKVQKVTNARDDYDKKLKEKIEQVNQSERINKCLKEKHQSLEMELQEERKNLKIKVVEVKDETLELELEMYKRQCRQLMQERLIMNTLKTQSKVLDPHYKIMNDEN